VIINLKVNVELICYLSISHEYIIAKFVEQIENKLTFYTKGLKVNKKKYFNTKFRFPFYS
jgi:hypothetical protein